MEKVLVVSSIKIILPAHFDFALLVSLQRLNFVDVATGSLGQGLSCAAGMAYTGKYIDKVG